jgi:NADH-quinone oxidoreductase subunit J
LNAGREERTLGSRAATVVGFPAVVALLAVLATVILHTPSLAGAVFGDNLSNEPGKTNLDQLSTVLFTKLLLPFEVTSVLILIAILGAVALARHDDGERAAGE